MNAVILAGGRGTRISEESQDRPKPMVDIGGRPILWHIMKIYTMAGITNFIVLVGYKGYMIKEYFANYFLHMSDVTIDLSTDSITTVRSHSEPWKVTLLDTGLETQTGGRLLRAKQHIGDETFSFTYGDGITDLDVRKVIAFHKHAGVIATVTAVRPPARYGRLTFEGDRIEDGDRVRFNEKPAGAAGWVSGGFFVAEPSIWDYIDDDTTVFERTPLERLSADGELAAYKHDGYWHGMDTLWDKIQLNSLWAEGKAPWKTWAD